MTKTRHLLKLAVIHVLLTGIALSFHGEWETLQSNVSGGGATLFTALAGDESLHGAAVVQQYASAAAAKELVLGLLLILMGFMAHALLASHHERRVRVTAVDPDEGPLQGKPATPPLSPEKKPQWFWVEMKIS